jgi:acetolactate decarboxylase
MPNLRTSLLLIVLLTACNGQPATNSGDDASDTEDTIFYASLNQAIHQGQYDGVMSLGELKEHGDIGVGSTERLAYELVMVDGNAYGIPADGQVYELPDTTQIPFAAVKAFSTDERIRIEREMSLEMLEQYLDSLLTRNTFAALKITGHFASIDYRSFHPQRKPYRPTDEVPDVLFSRTDLEAVAVGFYTPESAEVLNSPVYHFHFVDKDRTTGGHILDCRLTRAEIEIDYARGLNVRMAEPAALQHIDLNQPVSD